MNMGLPMEGRALPFQLPSRFERFYRQHLRRVVGARIRSSELMAVYNEWAVADGQGSVTFALVRTCMEAIGHARRQSNGVWYVDVAFAQDYPEQPDALPTRLYVPAVVGPPAPASPGASSDLVGKIDQALRVLLDVRQVISAIDFDRDPSGAAERLLGLLDQATG